MRDFQWKEGRKGGGREGRKEGGRPSSRKLWPNCKRPLISERMRLTHHVSGF